MVYLNYNNKNSGEIFIQEEIIEDIKDLTALIFDCDGVLLNTSKSFDQTIKDTVEYIFTKILHLKKPISPYVINEDIMLLRNTGGLGNDWDLTFMIIQYYFAIILLKFKNSPNYQREIVQTLKNLPNNYKTIQDRIAEFKSIENLLKKLNIAPNYLITNKENGNFRLIDLTNEMDAKGIESGRNILLSKLVPLYEDIKEVWRSLENLFGYEQPQLKNLTKRIFEEIYLGPDAFKRIYNSQPLFNFSDGHIKTESLIPSVDLFEELIFNYGIEKFGIASSRPADQALYVLT
ncbi:MAG: hypothetical protein ACTSR3_02150, partial [Candidatus Helarchaeota archaeon]